tara:strand:+ start:3138 stop:3320 length:183 start_codon:yes stop_codon:yes gene_type:complete
MSYKTKFKVGEFVSTKMPLQEIEEGSIVIILSVYSRYAVEILSPSDGQPMTIDTRSIDKI